MFKKKLILIVYSIILVPIWGLVFLDKETSTRVSVFIGFIFTLYSYLVLSKYLQLNRVAHKLVALSGPILYIISFLYFKPFNILEFIFFPVLWLSTYLFILIFFRNINLKTIGIFFLFACYLYSFHIFPVYQRLIKVPESDLVKDMSLKKSEIPRHSLGVFNFLDASGETVSISKSSKPILVETWNEKCGPCIESIKALENFIADSTNFKHIYLYQKMGKENLDDGEVFNFPTISDSSKILRDLDNSYFKLLNMDSYPYFILYDSDGNYLDHFIGFNKSISKKIKNRLVEWGGDS